MEHTPSRFLELTADAETSLGAGGQGGQRNA